MPLETHAPATAPAAAPSPVTLFYSYAHEDEALRDELQDHLAILERRRVIQSWHDRAIVPGQDWSRAIDDHLRQADLVLLLLSKDFIASDYIMGVELEFAMQRQQRGEATVVPILLRPVDLQPEDAQDMPFVNLLKPQGLPRDLKPVTTWANRDEAWTQVAGGLRATVNALRERRPQGPPPPAAPMRAPADRVEHQAVVDTPAARPSTQLAERVADDVAQRIVRATEAKGGARPDEAVLVSEARRLIDLPDAKRVLWVDDHPENNRAEAAALARLQIEVTAVRSSDEGLAALAAEPGTFNLVVSDWTRPADGALAGLRLLAAMRERGHRQPVIYYHGTAGAVQRAALAAAAGAAGAYGEAALPAELMRLVLGALQS